MMQYTTIKLQHDNETGSTEITESINEYAKDGWTLHSTQFLPTIDPTKEGIGSGDLVLIFQREHPDPTKVYLSSIQQSTAN